MKKLLLTTGSAAALFAAGPALAQANTSEVTQTGARGQVSVTQTGSLGDSTVSQGGSSNAVTVSQSGAGAESVITQDNGTGSSDDNNRANVTQDGDSYSSVTQVNDNAEADVQQTGDDHSSTVFQTGRSEEHTSELQSRENLVCRLLLEK